MNSITSGSVSAEVPVEFVLSSASPSSFIEHCIHANELNNWLQALPHTKCKQTKKNRESTEKYGYQK
jgi:hypothetical protein